MHDVLLLDRLVILVSLKNRVCLRSGCAPEGKEIFQARKQYDATVELAEMAEENEHFPVNRELRKIEPTAADMAFVNG